MPKIKRITFIGVIFCAGFTSVYWTEVTEHAQKEKPPSTWELIRKSQMKQTESAEPVRVGRVLHFPKERSLGRLIIGEENLNDRSTPFSSPADRIRWEYYSRAQGDVKIPHGMKIGLALYPRTWQNPHSLSALEQLHPDDLFSLSINIQENETGPSPDDRCIPYIAHLTGLKNLTLINTNISAKGLKYLGNLTSLERLNTRIKLTDEGLTEIVRLSSLKALSIKDNSLINNDLAQLAKLPLLEELELIGKGHVNDAGLAYLANIPRLKYLMLEGLVFTDAGMAHLKNCSSLRILDLFTQRQLTNTTLIHISEITGLEHLNLYWNENITDIGIAYLTKLQSLKTLRISHSKITDEGLVHLSNIKSLEHLELPGGLTDEGFKHIIQLYNLRFLRIGGMSLTDQSLQHIGTLSNLEELHIGGKGLSDEGMKHILKLPNLKYLSISGTEKLTNKGLEELTGLESLMSLSLSMNRGTSVSGLKSLNRLKNLKTLSIRDIHHDGSVMDISGLTKLEHCAIRLRFVRSGGSMVYDLFRDEDLACLANLTKLKSVSITGLGISDRGISHLSGLINLESLNITCRGEERITDNALKHLANMHKLKRLVIMDGHFTDKALDYLDDLPSLTELELTSDFAFNNQAIRDFQRKNPNITKLKLIP